MQGKEVLLLIDNIVIECQATEQIPVDDVELVADIERLHLWRV